MVMKLYDIETGQEIDFFIPEKFDKIAVNCSGGADSSLLLYMVVDFLEKENRKNTKITVLTCANDFKGRWNARNSTSVINFIIEKTKTNLIDKHLSYYRDVQDKKYFHEVEYGLINRGEVNLIVSGITANPMSGDTTVYDITGKLIELKDEALPERDGTNNKVWAEHEEASWYTPFANIDKKFISAMYKKYNLVDSLLPLTRSCESFGESTQDYTQPCGKCWWCLERKWGFGTF